ncbi:MAG: ABC transporter permease [Bacillota bacterium]
MDAQRNERKENFKESMKQLAYPLIAILVSFIAGGILVAAFGNNPVVAYSALIKGSLGDVGKVGETLVVTTYLILTGLSVAFAFRCGLFNIGAEGQFIIGTLVSLMVGYSFKGLPAIIHVPLTLALGALGGGIWGGIIGWLKARLGSHEVINSIMMNYIAYNLCNYLTMKVFGVEGKAFSVEIADSAKLFRFSDLSPAFQFTRLSGGILLSLAAAFITYYLLNKTIRGYEVRAVGFNQYAAEYGGISVPKNVTFAMFYAGALSGLAGAIMTSGMQYRVNYLMGFTGYGMDGIAVALVGNNHPIGVILSALLFGILQKGGPMMQIEGIAKEVVFIVQGILILFVAAGFVKTIHDNMKAKKAAKLSREKLSVKGEGK